MPKSEEFESPQADKTKPKLIPNNATPEKIFFMSDPLELSDTF